MNTLKNRITYFDSLKGIAIIGVVFIHTLKYEDKSFIDFSIIFRQLINFSVPLFLALSGFFLAETKIKNKEEYFLFLKKRIPRVYLPYLIWSILYISIEIILLKKINIGHQLFSIITFQTKGIFYFVALIIQFYILFPMLQKYLGKNLLKLSSLFSLLACILIFLYQYFTKQNLPLILYAGNAFTWVLFFVLGMYLRHNKIKLNKITLVILLLFSLTLSIFETYLQLQLTGNISNSVTAVKISSFIYSTFVIILLFNYKYPLKTVLYDLGKVSFAIYLLHLIILMVLIKVFLIFKVDCNGILAELIIGTFTILISYLICIVLRKLNPVLSTKYLGI